MTNPDLQRARDEILTRADIAVHAKRAGFQPKGKKAWLCGFHKNTKTPAASIRNGRVHCFGECARSWDLFEITMQARGLDFMGALRELAGEYGVPIAADRKLTDGERRRYARQRAEAEREAVLLGRLARTWHREHIGALEDAKRAAAETDDTDALAYFAAEVYRLQRLGADAVVAEYLRFREQRPAECAMLLRAGQLWDIAVRGAVDAVLECLAAEQRLSGGFHAAA